MDIRLDLPLFAMTRNRISAVLVAAWALAPTGNSPAAEPPSVPVVVGQFCIGCHDPESAKGGLNLAAVVAADVDRHPQVWEKVVRRMRGRQMPPAGRKRPDEAAYDAVLA